MMVQFDLDVFAHPWLQLVPLAQQITLSLSGVALLFVIMVIGAYTGYQQGLRNLLTVAFWTILAYLLTVQGGNFIVNLINRFWVNGPRLVSFLIGNDPDTAPVLDPVIRSDFQIPLFFRVLAFFVLVLLGVYFNGKAAWKGAAKDPVARALGLFVGTLIALLWANAAVVFWDEYTFNGGTFGGPLTPLAIFLTTLPNVSVLIPSLIAAFFLMIIALIAVNFPKVWKP
jgi:hypothetical protein